MFNKNEFKELGNNIYVYHNFLSEQECEDIMKEIELIPEKDWIERNPMYFLYGSKTKIKSLNPAIERMNSFMPEGLYSSHLARPSKMIKGGWRHPHSDINEFQEVLDESKKYVEGNDFDLADLIQYGTIMYFNDFEGCKLFYPNQNNLEYQPKKGDLLVHGAEELCRHGLTELFSEVRYFAVGHFFTQVKVPKGSNFFRTKVM
jgi:hypothetical protein